MQQWTPPALPAKGRHSTGQTYAEIEPSMPNLLLLLRLFPGAVVYIRW